MDGDCPSLDDERRCQWLQGTEAKVAMNGGPVLYWMHRDKRAEDNWALIKAQSLALAKGAGLAVVFMAKPKYMHWGERHFSFALKGLKQVQASLAKKNIPMYASVSLDPAKDVAALAKKLNASAIVLDFLPLRDKMAWDEALVKSTDVPVARCDAHNIVPLWVTSGKLEYAARTIRRKVMDQLEHFLTVFPKLATMPAGAAPSPDKTPDFDAMLRTLKDKHGVAGPAPVDAHFPPGPDGAEAKLSAFLTKKRLGRYDTHRNDPTKDALSNLSPYFNHGFLAAQSAVRRVKAFGKEESSVSDGVKSFVEEAVVRRELSDNFCFYNKDYDSLDAAYGWAQETLKVHAADKREQLYSYEQFVAGETHDDLWNAAQLQLVSEGKLHGFLRMYWCKKILEWTESPEEALRIGQALNDKLAIDGNDPNGYVGVGWSIMGIHDQGWKERPVFGKIRYMNYNGCKRKFDIKAFVDRYPEARAGVKKSHKLSEPSAKRAAKEEAPPPSKKRAKKT